MSDPITQYLSVDLVEFTFVTGGTSTVYHVEFIKEDGSLRVIQGVLVKPIEGPIGVNVTLLTDDGYKKFNTGRVLSIT